MNRSEVIELIRLAYLQGHQDTVDGNVSWCRQGSREIAEEIYWEAINEQMERESEQD